MWVIINALANIYLVGYSFQMYTSLKANAVIAVCCLRVANNAFVLGYSFFKHSVNYACVHLT